MIFPFGHDCSCRWMTDFLEKSILLDDLCGTFPNEKAKVKDECYCKICSEHYYYM